MQQVIVMINITYINSKQMRLTIKGIIIILAIFIMVKTSYNLTQSKLMVGLSKLTYDNLVNLTSWNCKGCSNYTIKNHQIVYIKNKNLLSITGYLPKFDCFVAAFRGTDLDENVQNVVTVINMVNKRFKLCSSCSVHKGFYEAFTSINETIFTNLNKLKTKYGAKKIIFGGHSLGGVLAALTALQYKIIFQNAAVQVYTYGEPRIGNTEFANYFNSKIPEAYRVVYKNDIIPHLPAKISGFRHQGTQIYYTNSKMTKFSVCTGDQSGKCSNSVLFPSISDHLIKQYLKLLNLPDQATNKASTNLVHNIRHALNIKQ